MIKPRGSICNLDCKYCYYLKKEQLYPDSDFRMPDEMLETFTRQYIQAQRVNQVTFGWQGGEPTLMGLDFFKKAVEFQKKYARPGMQIQNTFQTNGTLLDDEWCAFLKENNFLIGISIDGPARLHNAFRKDKGGFDTHDKVIAGLKLLKAYQVPFNVLTTVHAENLDYPLEVYRYLRDDLGAKFIQLIPIVERDNKKGEQRGNKITSRSVTGVGYGRFLIAVFDEWVRRDVGKVFVQIFDVALAKWTRQPGGLCIFNETCGANLALEHNGDLYACDHYVEPRYRLGNLHQVDISSMVGSHRQEKFGEDKKSTLPKFCRECDIRFVCNGGCPKNRVLHTPDGEFGLNYLCAGYKAFFRHIDPAMNTMANLLQQRQPPARIMELLKDNPSLGN
jgi:uncharacterized protein